MVADFRRRFWVSLVLSIPVLALAPLIQGWLGLGDVLAFRGDRTAGFGSGVLGIAVARVLVALQQVVGLGCGGQQGSWQQCGSEGEGERTTQHGGSLEGGFLGGRDA